MNSQHNITLSFDPSILDDMHIQVQIRDCLPGEVKGDGGKSCILCGPDLFTFLSNETCRQCPENAKCSPSIITPYAGFWHSASKSTQMHECIVKDACFFEGRVAILEEAAKEAHKNLSILMHNDARYKQCAEVSANHQNI